MFLLKEGFFRKQSAWSQMNKRTLLALAKWQRTYSLHFLLLQHDCAYAPSGNSLFPLWEISLYPASLFSLSISNHRYIRRFLTSLTADHHAPYYLSSIPLPVHRGVLGRIRKMISRGCFLIMTTIDWRKYYA